jgi:trigger factor
MLIQQARQQYRPEDQDRFVQYIQQDPMAAAQLRAPLYEDKVVDFLFDKATITEREVTREELEAAIEAEETTEGAKPKKAPAKKAAAKKDADKAEPAKKAPAKKAAAKEEPAKKAPAKKAEAKPAAEKPAAKKAPAKKAAAKK